MAKQTEKKSRKPRRHVLYMGKRYPVESRDVDLHTGRLGYWLVVALRHTMFVMAHDCGA